MAKFDEYRNKFRHIVFERHDGILQMLLHSDNGPLQWGPSSQDELVRAFTEVGADRDNRLVILSGTGNEFSGPKALPGRSFYKEVQDHITADLLDRTHWNAKRLLTRMLDIEVPIIGIINGPAMRHSEIPLMCDIVLAADDATLEDTAHFQIASQVPGDGLNIVYTLLLGINRARYFMLMGQIINARQALELGLVAEVMPREALLPRAWEIARQLATKNDLLLRYTRVVLTQPLRNWIERDVMYHLGLEALAKLDKEDVHSDDQEIAEEAKSASPKNQQ